MKSPTPSKNKVFTLLEMLVVIFIFLFLAGLVFDSSLKNFERSSVYGEADTLIALLQHSRSKAMSNICRDYSCVGGSPHGLYIKNDSFVVFEGASFNSAKRTQDQIIPRNSGFISSGVQEVVFENLSGDTTSSTNIILTDPAGQKIIINIGQEGQIIWED